jgi:uncharacterized protein YegP (UPF0339 family)
MAARYEIRRSKNPQQPYYWTLQGNNNEVLLVSETYSTKDGCRAGIASAKKNSPYDSRYHRGTATNGQYFFTLRAENNQVLGTSETYTTASGRDAGIEVTKKVGPIAPEDDRT